MLVDGESIKAVSIDLGLTTDSILRQWVKSYIENGYNVVTNKKGRPSTRDKEKEDGRRAGEGEQTPSRATIEENNRERIIKKTTRRQVSTNLTSMLSYPESTKRRLLYLMMKQEIRTKGRMTGYLSFSSLSILVLFVFL